MHTLLTNQLLPALAWTLVHSLWQGLALTILAGLVMLLTRRSTAALRYSLLCALFFLFLGVIVVTLWIEWKEGERSWYTGLTATDLAGTLVNPSPFGQWVKTATAFLNTNAPWLVGAWTVVFAFKAGRILVDILYIQRLRNHGTLATGRDWMHKVESLSQALGIPKAVLLAESALVKVPVVIGYFKPLIFLPVGLLTQLAPGDVEAILLHELAHIRRHDYVVNFIQRLSEIIFFFNPGLLWVSSLLRIEREACCDDIAIFHTNNKAQFVAALIRCKEHSLNPPAYALGLFGKQHLLLHRLTRIVYNRNRPLSPFEAAFSILSLVALTVLLSGMRLADRPSRQVVPHPAVENGLSHNEAVAKKSAAVYVPKQQQQTKPVGKRLRTQVTSNTSFRSTGQNIKPTVLTPKESERANNPAENYFAASSIASLQTKVNVGSASQSSRGSFDALRLQAEQDRQQAERDRVQAERDREQAQKDRVQAERDREQAQKDRVQAEKDRQQAEKDREQFVKDRVQAKSDRTQAEQNRQAHGYQQ